MNAHISRIIVFKKNLKKDEIPLTKGLNIITGRSQTGKSALFEIIDYCLLNSNSSIPKGIISENVILYIIVLTLKNKQIILARKSIDNGGKTKIFFNKVDKNFEINSLTFKYFKDKEIMFRPISEVRETILNEFGSTTVKRLIEKEGVENYQKLSIRNITSFIFQQQNLIANKYALFYRFDDYFKRNNVIEEFPILMGMVDQRYYNLKQEKDKLIKQKKDISKKILIKEEENKIRYSKIKELEKDLNIILSNNEVNLDKDNIDYNNLLKENERLLSEIGTLKIELREINARKISLKETINNKNKIAQSLEKKINLEIKKVEYCPICKNKLTEFNKEAEELIIKKNELKKMFFKENGYFPNLKIKISALSQKENELKENILEIQKRINDIQNILKTKENSDVNKILKEKELEIIILKENNIFEEKENFQNLLEDLENKIKEKTHELKAYQLENKIKAAENIISKKMSELANDLEFEKELGNPNFKVNLDNFNVYHYYKDNPIFISSMGSGSNWLTVHLSLFLAINYFICKSGEACIIPNILMLDQPSQVYFPEQMNENSRDMQKVTNIYLVILKYIEKAKKETGIEPQIIIVDHANNLNLEKEGYNYQDYVKANWHEEGIGFITDI